MVKIGEKSVQLGVDRIVLSLGRLKLASEDPDARVGAVLIALIVDGVRGVVGIDDGIVLWGHRIENIGIGGRRVIVGALTISVAIRQILFGTPIIVATDASVKMSIFDKEAALFIASGEL